MNDDSGSILYLYSNGMIKTVANGKRGFYSCSSSGIILEICSDAVNEYFTVINRTAADTAG